MCSSWEEEAGARTEDAAILPVNVIFVTPEDDAMSYLFAGLECEGNWSGTKSYRPAMSWQGKETKEGGTETLQALVNRWQGMSVVERFWLLVQ